MNQVNGKIIDVQNVGKKFCRRLRYSMFYGALDVFRSMLGISLDTDSLRKSEFWAVDDISFSIKQGESIGVIGPNGSGKSTLLKLLNGIFMPDKGKIEICGRVGALIEVGAGFHPLLSGRENIYINGAILGMSKKEIDRKFNDIVAFADIGEFLDTPVKSYSSGMYVRLGFAIAIHGEPDILLIDEVLAVGDSGFQQKCFNKIGELKEKGTTTILVSHNMHAITTFAERVVLLNKGKAEYFDKVAEGVKAYTRLFIDDKDLGIEKICSGNDKIQFFDVEIEKRKFSPGDSLSASLPFKSSINYDEVEIDIAIYSSNEVRFYFQATNKAYQKEINLKTGEHSLNINIEKIPMNNSLAKLVLAIWSKERNELLFWWKIPLEFRGKDYCTGNNFLNVAYDVK